MVMKSFNNLQTEIGLKKLNGALRDISYIREYERVRATQTSHLQHQHEADYAFPWRPVATRRPRPT